MKTKLSVVSIYVALIHFTLGLESDLNNINDLVESSNHGHATGVAIKEKRCREPLHFPLYDQFLGSARQSLLPSVLTRRNAIDACEKCKRTYCTITDRNCKKCSNVCPNPNENVQLAPRFKADEIETGLSESQERYYTVGSFGPGPKQHILARLLNIPENVQLERLIVMAKNKSKSKPSAIPHPVVIDTAHVFTTNDGHPAELPMELHTVKAGGKDEDINNLTSQLNKELDAAIDTKKNLRGESHLTPEEIDKIIDHVLDQMKKKTPVDKQEPTGTGKQEIVGNKMEDMHNMEEVNKSREAEVDDGLDGFKKKKKKKGSKKHGFIDEDDDVLGEQQQLSDFDLTHPIDEDRIGMENPEDHLLENQSLLGSKKGFGFKGHKGLKLKGKGKGKGYYRENEAMEEDPHHEMTGSENSMNTPSKINVKPSEDDMLEIADLPESDSVLGTKKGKGYGYGKAKGKGKGGHYRENQEEDDENPIHAAMTDGTIGLETPDQQRGTHSDTDSDLEDSMLGTKKKFKGGSGKGGYGKKQGLGKFKKGHYRENDDPDVGSSQPYQSYFPSAHQQNPQYAPSGSEQKYGGNQQTYEEHPNDQYSEDLPVYEQPEPETYHGNSPEYQPPQSASQYQQHYQPLQQYQQEESQMTYQQPEEHQTTYQQPQTAYQQPQEQPSYQQPQMTYQQPQKPQTMYQQPQYASQKAYQPQPQAAPAQPQAAYSNAKSYKAVEPEADIEDLSHEDPATAVVEDILGHPKDIPEDPTLKANFFENEYHRLRQWIEGNGPSEKSTPKVETEEKEGLVDKFTKVIEKDLTDGKKLTPLEKKNLDKKIAKLVRDNLDSDDPKGSEAKSRKKLDKLEELVEEEADENQDEEYKLGSQLGDFKTRFSPKKDETPMKRVETMASKLRSSMDNLKKDRAMGENKWKRLDVDKIRLTTMKPLLPLGTQKPALDLKDIVEDLKSMPNSIKEGANKLSDLVAPSNKLAGLVTSGKGSPKLGMRAGMTDEAEAKTNPQEDETVGCLEDLKDKLHDKKDKGEWYVEPHYDNYHDDYHGGHDDYGHHHDDYGHYRDSEKKKDALGLDKLFHLRKNPEGGERSGEEATPTLPELIRNLEENIQENLQELHIPTLAPLPGRRQNHHQGHKGPHSQAPKIEVNGKKFIPDQQNVRPPLPESPPQGQIRPQFQRNFAQNPQNQQFQPPVDQFQNMQPQPPFVGAVQQQPNMNHDMRHFGKIVPEHIHDLHLRDLTEQMKKNENKMYFIGDGIRLPLHMHRHGDGTLHLSVDLEKLCKCNSTGCRNTKSKLEEPDFISTNILGSKGPAEKPKDLKEIDEEGIDFGDAPLMMAAPNLEDLERGEKQIAKRSPRFKYYDVQPQAAEVGEKTPLKTASDEQFDVLSTINQATKDRLQKKINDFNEDIKEYYANEQKIKTEKLSDGEVESFLEKRLGLLSNILKFLQNVTVDGSEVLSSEVMNMAG